MEMLWIYAQTGLIVFAFFTALWLLSLYWKDSSIVDIFWGFGFVVAAWVYFYLTPDGYSGRKWLLCALVSIWGLRLSGYIFLRNRGKGEDYRYANWRRENGQRWWWWSFFQVFLLQAIILWVISTPLLTAQFSSSPAKKTWLDDIAVFVWGIGFFFEAIGDWQLNRFKANPANKGKLLNTGVWKYTRHPNYFGDAVQWWGFYLFALAAGGWWTIFSPILMTYLLVRVSGVALLEKNLVNSKPGYAEYVRRTSAFIPWLPKK